MLLRPGPLLALLLLCSGAVRAEWELDGTASAIHFVSVKNLSLAEIHHFGSLAGFMGDDGSVEVAIDLDSVKTMIPIRDQRMREMLFETGSFPSAKVSTQLEESALSELLGAAGRVEADVQLTVDLHGVSSSYPATVTAFRRDDGVIEVLTRQPVVIRAADFGLDAGVEALRSIAGLKNIATAVPVTAHLVLSPASAD